MAKKALPDPPNIVLTGMMASGKTTVGEALAQRLGRPFVDLDRYIVATSGKEIFSLVEEYGEASFRELEREAVRRHVGVRGAVIATGGGALMDPGNRAAMEALGVIVCLSATPEALGNRMTANEALRRPLLGGQPEARLMEIQEARAPLYQSFPWQVDTTARDVPGVVEAILNTLELAAEIDAVAVGVGTGSGRGYGVLVGPGLLDRLGTILTARGLGRPAVVVTDPTVDTLVGGRVRASMAAAGVPLQWVVMGQGERSKSLVTVAELYRAFLDAGLTRDGLVIALGGGIVGDTAGFAAATYLRGVTLVAVPTTLLAMVDAAIGGKSGVNLPAGKNLVGAFHHPGLVLADPSVLATLPPDELRCGLAEVVKAAVIDDPSLLRQLEQGGLPPVEDDAGWTELVARSVGVKAKIVTIDPRDRDYRMILNLGHTFAHALERATEYRLRHGEAVAIGLAAAARLARLLGRTDDAWVGRIEGVLTRLGLPIRYSGPTPDDVLAAMRVDKKRSAGGLRFVLCDGPGRVDIVEAVPEEEVMVVLGELRVAE